MTAGNSPTLILTRNGKADPGQEVQLAALKTRLQQPDARLLLHLHGGLVNQASGEAAAQRLAGSGDNSWQLGPDWAQLYVIWRTGAFETLATNWTDLVHDDRLYQTILRKLISFVGGKLGMPAIGGTRAAASTFGFDEAEIHRRIIGQGDRRDPFGEIDVHLAPELPTGARAALITPQDEGELALEFQAQLAADDQFQLATGEIGAFTEVVAGTRGISSLAGILEPDDGRSLARLDASVRAEIAAAIPAGGPSRGAVSVGVSVLKHAGMIAYRVFKRFRNRRDHGFHATIVEEICRELYGDLVGAKVWGMMVQDAADHFAPGGFGTTLLDLLKDVPAPQRFAVTAHSAGSIWASRMLLALAARNQTARLRLIMLAPAARHDLFAETVGAAGNRIELCRMFTMTDELERKDAVLGHEKGYIYPSSLLYCVSGLFEERSAAAYPDAPLVGMQRYAGVTWLDPDEASNAQTITGFFSAPGRGIVTSPTPGITMADCHGCFDDEPLTLKSAAALF
ncbi:hypothetical protein CHU93_02080 [Sandarakinorhabdus cyanobacteriorum]|uniref:Alpha/beta hydrolase n=1 Tax=Sandarakinorhabdus cyanobacteriorum TaxID=1981098 RepID=A0A255Z1F2_9SPHN|nr:hypothetical protein [Sandarakinorhabdus cyanobacteriorum]OYQ34764.1 hypothetical protein CHU93_02080 [Sandarakinorhabdus cyanobacteriorum]